MEKKNVELGNRILDVVNEKCAGDKIMFCEAMQWSPQYLHKLITGVNIGLTPLISILDRWKDIDARWLLLGENAMTADAQAAGIKERLLYMLEMEKYIPHMTREEIANMQRGEKFDAARLAEWDAKIEARIKIARDAMIRSAF